MARPANTKKSAGKDVRSLILHTAQRLIHDHGVAMLTQNKVARAAGIRQSHLTYYFPRRSDLLTALLVHSHEHAEDDDDPDLFAGLARLIFDPNRARFLIAAITETTNDAESRAIVAAHLSGFSHHMARCFGRPADDAAVAAFVSQLRGMALENLALAHREPAPEERIREAALRLGLSLASDARRLL